MKTTLRGLLRGRRGAWALRLKGNERHRRKNPRFIGEPSVSALHDFYIGRTKDDGDEADIRVDPSLRTHDVRVPRPRVGRGRSDSHYACDETGNRCPTQPEPKESVAKP